jgi:DNA-binding NarL/FixJ family response regulator
MAQTHSIPPIRVLCVDDHPLVRKGIAAILANERDIQLVAEGGDGHEAVRLFRLHRPDVTLLDMRMPGLDGMAAARTIGAEFPGAKIIALTIYDTDHEVYRALEAGISGYLLKEMVHAEVLRAIRLVHSGQRLIPPAVAARLSQYFSQSVLTPREVEVLREVARGLSNKEIADRLGAASGTIKIHMQNILGKLQVADRTHAVTVALQRGIIRLDP